MATRGGGWAGTGDPRPQQCNDFGMRFRRDGPRLGSANRS
jgi:hypothetical protein